MTLTTLSHCKNVIYSIVFDLTIIYSPTSKLTGEITIVLAENNKKKIYFNKFWSFIFASCVSIFVSLKIKTALQLSENA